MKLIERKFGLKLLCLDLVEIYWELKKVNFFEVEFITVKSLWIF